MPVYEYECASCESVTEAIRKMADADQPLSCESCGSQKTTRKHSVFMTAPSSSSAATATPAATRGCGAGGGGCACHP